MTEDRTVLWLVRHPAPESAAEGVCLGPYGCAIHASPEVKRSTKWRRGCRGPRTPSLPATSEKPSCSFRTAVPYARYLRRPSISRSVISFVSRSVTGRLQDERLSCPDYPSPSKEIRMRGSIPHNSNFMFVTLTAVATESAAGQVARSVWSFPRCACARATLGA